MVRRLYKRPQVDLDLDSIWDFIASDNVTAADRVLDRIGEVLDMLIHHPLAGRQRPELAPGLRSFPVGNYIVFYLPLDDSIEVVRILTVTSISHLTTWNSRRHHVDYERSSERSSQGVEFGHEDLSGQFEPSPSRGLARGGARRAVLAGARQQ